MRRQEKRHARLVRTQTSRTEAAVPVACDVAAIANPLGNAVETPAASVLEPDPMDDDRLVGAPW